ncbi:uncharacterized protein LOC122304804 [Carya illinoinensis]|uniref:uncharacterized protein LOC122304804 n=1 Tax=Carya illinoinensis TaxID=32201 RepID=UPI001C71F73D|nr:uncharacterized protein LOC122304804 [Carya illinoinensis]
MRVPNKVRVFAWRLCKDSLPSKLNLCKRKILENTTCEFCNYPIEDISHGMLNCQDIKDAWKQLLPEYRINKWNIEHSLLSPMQTAHQAIGLQKTLTPPTSEPSYLMQKLGCWCAPPTGFCKINVDAALFFDLRKVGVGAVVSDERGNMLMAVNKVEHELNEPESVETLAMLRGLQFILHLEISKVVLESDCLLMVEALSTNTTLLSTQGNILQEIWDLLRLFDEHKVQHVVRSENK